MCLAIELNFNILKVAYHRIRKSRVFLMPHVFSSYQGPARQAPLKRRKSGIAKVVIRRAQVNIMKHLLLNLVVFLSILQSGKSMFLISVRHEGIVRSCRTLYAYELTTVYRGVLYTDISPK